ncbi:MAG: UDP-2,3-diacylglucosamine diphosphatase LpxI [Kiritimatiellae bacterium]|nr:UDP-2,3-diacylglucosamine diphosphatase LpxI [Kiritimatiellia bacterium]MDW8458452.1 UDP-2,3-diacylglucosamine diphosphatase LpxI [Verrucomicrobiota bacterium]
MLDDADTSLAIIAGKGVYPLELARSARAQGVRRIFVAAFKGETDRAIHRLADEVKWLHVGQLGALLETLKGSGIRRAVMVGQITPTLLFRARPDGAMLNLLGRLRQRNAETIFGAVAEELKAIGIDLLPASRYMEAAMPKPGMIGTRPLTAREESDIALGFRVAKTISGLDIGQTVVVKEGTILAVEAFEGTDAAIRRAGKLGGPGSVVVKVAKRGHDMRFDLPVIGTKTFKSLRRARASALAVEAGRAILLERDRLVEEADRLGIAFVAVAGEDQGS